MVTTGDHPPPSDNIACRGVKCWGSDGVGQRPHRPTTSVGVGVVRRLRKVTCVRKVQGMDVFSAWVPGRGAPDYEQDLRGVMLWLCEEEKAVRDAWRGRVPQWRQRPGGPGADGGGRGRGR